MIMKSSLGKMLRKMPQKGDAGSTPSDMIARLGNLLGGNQQTGGVIDNRIGPGFGRPMQPPMAYPGGSSNFDESTGVYTPDDQGLRGFMSRFGGLLNKGPGRTVGYRAFDEGVGGGGPVSSGGNAEAGIPLWMQLGPSPERDAAYAAHIAAGGAPSPVTEPQRPEVTPPAPSGGLTLATTRPDPEFNINTATNTFFKSLGDRVASGQMTLDQARAAQAEMRALQLNPAMANRQAATEIAQRHLQVGPYSPNNMRQLTPAVMPPVTQPSPFQRAERTLGNAPAFPTTRMPTPEERILADQQMMPMLKTPIREVPMMRPLQMVAVGTPMAAPQGLTLSNVPQQGAAPQPMTAPQGMAMGGLMAKYYGGAC